ncbi:GNAT family N-acetyltransferase [Nocardioides bigeumensis]|uniref:N-acetyltransferase domain-containing protein n=1 Tax=Nocardioides bigeumensis TaxID=433657 RepID=A0ABN2XL32_9ACTN
MQIRPAHDSDLDAVKTVYDHDVRTSVATFDLEPAYARARETSLYLSGQARGRGIGRAVYDDLLARLRADDVHTVLALVALTNDASLALHRA